MPLQFLFPLDSRAPSAGSVPARFVALYGGREYVLFLWNNLLYFSNHPQTIRSSVWTILESVPNEVQEDDGALMHWWSERMESGLFGLVWRFPDCMAVFGCYGNGQLRAWWDATGGEPFRWPNCEAAQPLALLNEPDHHGFEITPIWNSRWYWVGQYRGEFHALIPAKERHEWESVPFLGHGVLLEQARNRARPSFLLADRGWEWKHGSLQEFVSLAKAILHRIDWLWENRASLDWRLSSTTPGGVGSVFPRENIISDDGWIFSGGDELLSLLIHDFVPFGWKWARGRVNKGWECNSLEWEFAVSAPQSHHERIEAHLQVRNWLESLVAREALSASDADLLFNWRATDENLGEFEDEVYRRIFLQFEFPLPSF